MMVPYFFVAWFCVIWFLLWRGSLIGVGRTGLSIKSLAGLLLGFAVIFAVASQAIRGPNR